MQIKLAELICAMEGARNGIATAEDLSEEDLERLNQHYRTQADETPLTLSRRREGAARH